MSIGDRLKEEISRLRLNQTDMAAAGEVEEFTQEIFAEKRPVYDFALVFFVNSTAPQSNVEQH